MANTINWGKSYSQSYWGNATTTIRLGDDYMIEYHTSDLNRRVQIYENNDNDYTTIREYTMSLLQKASIITTPTAYAEDYLYSIKPAITPLTENIIYTG